MSFFLGILSIFAALHLPQWVGWQWDYLQGMRSKAAVSFGLMFIISGTTHFTNPEGFVAIMPPFLPEPLLLVYLSGIAEIGLGIGLVLPGWRSWVGVGAILLLLAVFPANVYAAINGIPSPGAPENSLYLWLRLPLQPVFIAWVWWATAGQAVQELSIKKNQI
ncbi:MAG: DoxX family membrane protein [Anaerolineales bacterium]|nr:DoxX family membrane protein [Anaerolineales bacterium]